MPEIPKPRISKILYHYIMSQSPAQLTRMEKAYKNMQDDNPKDRSIQNVLECIKEVKSTKEKISEEP